MQFWLVLLFGLTLTFDCCQGHNDKCVTLATFNAGLLIQVDEYESRKGTIPDALLANDADIYCLQEYWLEKDMEELLSHVSEVYPYHYSAIHHDLSVLRDPEATPSVDSACSMDDLTYFQTTVMACAVAKGCMEQFNISAVHGAACLTSQCSDELNCRSIHPDCIQCLLQFMKDIHTGAPECYPNPSIPGNRLNPPGLLLISKKRLKEPSYTKFYEEDLAVARGYLETRVTRVHSVVCTHLSSIFPVFFEYNMTRFSSYEEMNAYEVDSLISKNTCGKSVLLGDFNVGPAIPETEVSGEYPENYQMFEDEGFTNKYVDMPCECTYCLDNELTSQTNNHIIDHILVNNDHLEVTNAVRIMDDSDGAHPYSDHYGVQIQVCRNRRH